ncbi:hypothetical protein ACWDAO_39135 [Streptomyces sp. NPDC001212]
MEPVNTTSSPFGGPNPWEVDIAPWGKPAQASEMAPKKQTDPESLAELERASQGHVEPYEMTDEDKAAALTEWMAERDREPAPDDWQDMTATPMDWQRHMIGTDIKPSAKVLGVSMSHYCGPNSHGCSASIATLAANANMSEPTANRAVKALKDADLIRQCGTGMKFVKVYRLGKPA